MLSGGISDIPAVSLLGPCLPLYRRAQDLHCDLGGLPRDILMLSA